jgi:hypothetical protein
MMSLYQEERQKKQSSNTFGGSQNALNFLSRRRETRVEASQSRQRKSLEKRKKIRRNLSFFWLWW